VLLSRSLHGGIPTHHLVLRPFYIPGLGYNLKVEHILGLSDLSLLPFQLLQSDQSLLLLKEQLRVA